MAPPSPNTARGHLWEIAPVPILQLLVNLADKEFCGDKGRNMEILATNTNIDKMAIWQDKAKMARLYKYTHTHTHTHTQCVRLGSAKG